MEEDVIKIDELEYFNPFSDINLQLLDLKNPSVFSCNFGEQQQLFIYMACSNDIKNKVISQIRPPKIIIDRIMQQYKEQKDNQYPMYKEIFTKRDEKKLNNLIKKYKIKINNYIKLIKDSTAHTLLLESLYGTDGYITNMQIPIDQLPYVYYLQEVLRTFRLFSDTNNKSSEFFDDWNKIFKFENDSELFNFQGCLGLLLMNEFCLYYRNNDLKYCILCSMLMTILCIYSPIYKKIEKLKSKKIKKQMAELETQHNYHLKGADTRDRRYYRQFREIFKELQRKEYLKNPKLTANSFAKRFHDNPPIKIPYVEQNQLKTLRRLAEANNREFRKIYGN